MIPINKVRDLINKHMQLEKELAEGNLDNKKIAEKSKEYSDLNEVVKEAREYASYEIEKNHLQESLKRINHLDIFDIISANLHTEVYALTMKLH